MRIPAKRMTAMIMVAVCATAASALAASPEAARGFMSGLRDRAIDQLTDQGIGAEAREQRFRRMLHDSFDLPAIGRFVLAAYWRKTDEPARREFLEALETHAVHRFLPLFAQYEGQAIAFGEVRDHGREGGFLTVESTITRSAGAPIAVQWRVREEGGAYKIIDVVTEGASMAVTLRSEYRSVLRTNGGDVRDLAARIRGKAVQSAKAAAERQ